MRPVVLVMSDTLPGRPEVVWRLITEWEHLDDWMLDASDVRVTSEQREGIGVEAEALVRIGGLKTRDTVRVIGWEPGRRLVIEHLGWVKGVAEMRLTALGDDATFVHWKESLEPPAGIAGAIGLHAFKPLMRKTFERDLRVLKSLVRVSSAS